MLKRVALLLAVLVPIAWILASAFVALYEPGGLPDTTLVLTRPEGERPRWELANPPPVLEEPDSVAWLPLYGEGARGSVGIGSPEGTRSGHEYLLVRGALDAARGTFPLAVGLVFWGADPPDRVRIEVTRDADWGERRPDEVVWTEVGASELQSDGRWWWASIEGHAPAGAVAWRRSITERDGGSRATSQSLLRPRKRLDRLLEDLSAYGVFRWLATDANAK